MELLHFNNCNFTNAQYYGLWTIFPCDKVIVLFLSLLLTIVQMNDSCCNAKPVQISPPLQQTADIMLRLDPECVITQTLMSESINPAAR